MAEPKHRPVPREPIEGLYEIRDRFVVDTAGLVQDDERRPWRSGQATGQ